MLTRSFKILSQNLNKYVNSKLLCSMSTTVDVESDIAIIGGGIIGYSSAYWLKKENPKLKILVVEKDLYYKQCSTVLSVGGLRLQFSVQENIQMSLFATEVISNLGKYFSIGEEENVDIQFFKRGYLLLSQKEQEKILLRNFDLQRSLGAALNLLNKSEIRNNWPWINTDDIECGVYGIDCEGWFDPWLLLNVIRKKARQLGVISVNGSLVEFQGLGNNLKSAVIQLKDEKYAEINFLNVINASGCWASDIAILAERAIGLSGSDFPLYVTKAKRYVYNFHVADFPPTIITPMVVDSTGVYFRKESSGLFLSGLSPETHNEPNCDNLDVDYEWFDQEIWPKLYFRVPLMEALKVKSAWAGYYDYNTKDQNLIVGKHPAIGNLYLCNGSSGHGIQHALAIGRANMELILYGKFQTINLERFHYDRFVKNELIFESNIF